MKSKNLLTLNYVAGALYAFSQVMDDETDIRDMMASFSESLSSVVISETIDREEDDKPFGEKHVSFYMDDTDDGK